jgi:hypothetical protein
MSPTVAHNYGWGIPAGGQLLYRLAPTPAGPSKRQPPQMAQRAPRSRPIPAGPAGGPQPAEPAAPPTVGRNATRGGRWRGIGQRPSIGRSTAARRMLRRCHRVPPLGMAIARDSNAAEPCRRPLPAQIRHSPTGTLRLNTQTAQGWPHRARHGRHRGTVSDCDESSSTRSLLCRLGDRTNNV